MTKKKADPVVKEDPADKIDRAADNYLHSDKGKATREKYNKSPKRKVVVQRYSESEKDKLAKRKYYYSEKGQETIHGIYDRKKMFRAFVKYQVGHPECTIEEYEKIYKEEHSE